MSKSILASGVSSEPINTPTEASVLSDRTAPLSWSATPFDDKYFEICSADGVQIAEAYGEKFAALIVRAVNNHDALVKALQWFIDDIDGENTKLVDFNSNVRAARAALAGAK